MIALVPNMLTIARIAIGPLLWWCIVQSYTVMALVLVAVTMCTDYADGKVARAFDAETSLGAFLDPLADKVIILSGFSALAFSHVIEWWVVGVIAGRDVAVTLLRSYLLASGYELQTSWLAKSKTAAQFVALILFIIGSGALCGSFGYVGFSFKLVIYRMINVISVAIALLTLLSGLVYLFRIRRRVKPLSGKKESDDA